MFSDMLGHFNMFWYVLECFETLLENFGMFWYVLVRFGTFWYVLGHLVGFGTFLEYFETF